MLAKPAGAHAAIGVDEANVTEQNVGLLWCRALRLDQPECV